MEGYTPLLPTNSVFEMYTTMQDKESKTFFDTVMCSTEFWGLNIGITGNEFKVEDYQSSTVFFETNEVGTN